MGTATASGSVSAHQPQPQLQLQVQVQVQSEPSAVPCLSTGMAIFGLMMLSGQRREPKASAASQAKATRCPSFIWLRCTSHVYVY